MDRPRSPRYSATLTEASSAPAAPAPATPPSLAHPSAGRPGAQSIGTSDSPVIPDHNLIKCIGRGAYGEVWLARDVIGRHDAVKIVKARNFPHAAPYEREFKGIERYASISRNHPGLVQALHIGRRDAQGCFFYIMELADDASGATSVDPSRYLPKTLASELARRGHLPVQESVQIGLAMCGALGHLHERRLAHRDVKSSNIIFVEGAPKIADVGLVTPLAAGTGDLDHDGHTDSEEFRTGTNPANDASILRVLTLTSLGNGGKTILWSAAPGRTYRVQFKAGITDAEWSELPHLVTAAGTTASAADASSAGDSHRFYRVRLGP
jgi:serine/threonine protein kinase